MTSCFPQLIAEVDNGDFFTEGTAHNKFIKKIHALANETDITESGALALDKETIQDAINYALKKSNPIMERLLIEQKSREKLMLLFWCSPMKTYTNAFSRQKDNTKLDEQRRVVAYLDSFPLAMTCKAVRCGSPTKREL